MKIKFHHVLAFFLVTLFVDYDFKVSSVRVRVIDVWLLMVIPLSFFKSSKKADYETMAVAMLGLFIAYVGLNSAFKAPGVTAVKETLQIIEYVFLMFFIAEVLIDTKKRDSFFNVLLWGSAAVALFSVYYHVSLGIYSGYKELDAPKHAFAVFATLAVIKFVNTDKRSAFQILVIIGSVIMLLLSGERKGWAGTMIASGIYIWLQLRSRERKKKKRAFALLNFAIIGGVVLTSVAVTLSGLAEFAYFDKQLSSITDVSSRFFGSEEENSAEFVTRSNAERTFINTFAFKLYHENPVTGIGIDQFAVQISEATQGEIKIDAHNFFLKILVEQGLVGLCIFVIFNLIVIKDIWSKVRLKEPGYAQLASMAMSLMFLGITVNFFLAGKALSWLYTILPLAMVIAMERRMNIDKRILVIKRRKERQEGELLEAAS